MKFGSQLEAHAIPEWADRYIKYKDLKKWLSRRSAEIEKVAFVSVLARAAAAIHAADPPVPADSHRSEPLDSHRRRRGSETAEGPPDRSQLLAAAISDFAEEMEHELRKVEHHFNKERGFLLDRLEGVEFEVQSIEAKHMNSGDRKAAEQAVEAHRQRLQRAIISIWDIFEKLDSYVQLNTIAVYKILKKRNKMLGIDDSGDDLQHHRNRLAQLRMGEELKNRLLNLYHRASQPDEEYIEDFATIRAAVQREMLNMQRFPNLRALFFALGATAVLIVNVIVLLTAEASNPRRFGSSADLPTPADARCPSLGPRDQLRRVRGVWGQLPVYPEHRSQVPRRVDPHVHGLRAPVTGSRGRLRLLRRRLQIPRFRRPRTLLGAPRSSNICPTAAPAMAVRDLQVPLQESRSFVGP
eukprot:Polyplicarium_translucidae@DN2047_c0_g1_i1.p1